MSAPLLQQMSPADDSSGVAATANLVLTFNQIVRLGTSGTIRIYESDGTLFHTISITDAAQVNLEAGRRPTKVTINPNVDLDPGTSYYILMDAGTVESRTGDDFAGISSPTTFNFTTAGSPGGDTTAPTLVSTTPVDNATGVSVAADLVLTFSEAVQAGSGTIQIRKVSDNSLAQAISITDTTQVQFSGNQVTISPAADLGTSTAYYVLAAPGVVRDLANNGFAGILTPTSLNFTTAAVDNAAPTLIGTLPSDNENDVYVSTNLMLGFSEPVKAGTGNILIRKTSDDTIVQSISITDATQDNFSGNEVTINPSVNLSGDTSYYATLGSGVILDLANNPFAGISSPTTFNFTTGDGTPPVLTGSSFAGNAPVYADDPYALRLYFDESVTAYDGGDIEIHDASDGSIVRIISADDGSQVQWGGWVWIDPNPDLAEGKNYYITFGPGVFKDIRGNPFGGVSSPDTLAFTTIRTGTIGNDTLTGDDDDNAFDGGMGHDTLAGGDGDDTYILTNFEGGETSIVLQVEDSPFGGWFYSGRTLSLPFEDNEIMAAAYDWSGDGIVDSVHLWNYGPVDWWDFSFSTSPLGTNLVPGTYLDATDDLLAGHPFLHVSGNGGASLDLGSFTVTNAVFDYSGPSPTIVSLSISFETHSSFGTTQILGVANYNYAPAGPATLDTIIENPDEGTDTVKVASSYVLPANFENLTLTGGHDLSGTGNSANNVITGNEGMNLIDGKAGADTMIGGDGDDTYIVDNVGDHVIEENYYWWNGFDTVESSVTHALDSGVEKLILTGSANINGTGSADDNIMIGNAGANILGGAGGNDTYYIDSLADSIVENVGEGIDIVITPLSYTLGNNVDNLTLTGAGNLNGTGNGLDNTIIGTMKSAGPGGQNVLTGGNGNDTLDGRSGVDTLIGGLGNDTYVIDNYEGGQTSIVLEGEPGNYVGNGEIISLNDANSFDITLLDHSGDGIVDFLRIRYDDDIHNWLLEFSTADLGTNLAIGTYEDIESDPNEVVGVSGDGRGDSLIGSFTVSALNINYGGGTPVLVSAAITFGQFPFPDAPSLFGTVNYNYAPAGPAVLDTIVESAGGGIDTVEAAVSYTLGTNLDNLTLTGWQLNLDATGNELNNVLTGNNGVNILTGLGGDDTLSGGGNPGDTFKIGASDDGSDTITDFFFSPFPDVLPDYGNVVVLDGFSLGSLSAVQAAMTQVGANTVLNLGNGETLTFLNVQKTSFIAQNFVFLNVQGPPPPPPGPEPFTLPVSGAYTNTISGGRRADNLTGTSANNRLDGRQGNDTMTGLAGDDTYLVDASGDNVVESSGQGIDTVISSASSYTLANNVENLTLTGTTTHTATGNGLDNLIIASSRPDTINGGAGNDIIRAGTGACVLTGGTGNDIFDFDVMGSQKQITGFTVGEDLVDLRTLLAWYGGSDPLTSGAISLSAVAGGVLVSVKASAGGALQGLVKITGVSVGDLDVGSDILWDA
jgi:Ca2+-binding RTX toxin-like protein/methionine-rich copper-binding protein CopC